MIHNQINVDSRFLAWMQLARSKNIGPTNFNALISVYKSPEKAISYLLQHGQHEENKFSIAKESEIEQELELAHKMNAKIIPSYSSIYPNKLKNIPNNPPVITTLGNNDLLHNPSMAIVGSRNASINSIKLTHDVTRKLSYESKNTIISGLAYGIDAAAHESSVNAPSSTIASIATGMNIIYPQSNKKLFKTISENGLIITEFPMSTTPKPYNFPQRNRIIAALSDAVIIMEASLKSGSLITAKHAIKQGKYLFAVPGSPLEMRSQGTNHLIKSGHAILISSAEDIIQYMKTHPEPPIIDNLQNDSFFDNQPESLEFFAPNDQCEHTIDIPYTRKIISDSLSSSAPTPKSLLLQHLELPINMMLVALIELEIENKIHIDINDGIILTASI